jgi:hypothetical protein
MTVLFAPIPLNLLYRWSRSFYYRFAATYPDWWEAKISKLLMDERSRAVEYADRKSDMSYAEGYRHGQLNLMSDILAQSKEAREQGDAQPPRARS